MQNDKPAPETTTVWVVGTGAWEDRMIWGVASSVEAAARLVRSAYPPPYIVRWEEPKQGEDGEWSMTGHFDAVPGYAPEGADCYDFTPYQLDRSRHGDDDVILSPPPNKHTDSAERILYNETIVNAVINAIGDTEGEPLGLRAATVIAAIDKAAGGTLLDHD